MKNYQINKDKPKVLKFRKDTNTESLMNFQEVSLDDKPTYPITNVGHFKSPHIPKISLMLMDSAIRHLLFSLRIKSFFGKSQTKPTLPHKALKLYNSLTLHPHISLLDAMIPKKFVYKSKITLLNSALTSMLLEWYAPFYCSSKQFRISTLSQQIK